MPESAAALSHQSHELSILGWKSSYTDRLLSRNGLPVDEQDVVILDGAMGSRADDDHRNQDFSAALHRELRESGLLDGLQPSRTTGEKQSQEIILQLLQGTLPAAADVSSAQQPVRGDRSLFVAREYRQSPNFQLRHRYLHALVSTLSTAVAHAVESYNNANGSTTKYTLDLADTSVQVATFPGDGASGYVRHCDRGHDLCRHETPASLTSQPQRLLTTIYYLTEPDWDASLDGGALRVFGTDGDDDDDDDYTDITPHRGRLVMFRSDRVEHQVMPSLRRPRTAITVWFYGSMEKTTTEQTAPSVSLPPPLLLQATPIRQSSRESSKIFVSIPSFRDSETVPTLNALFATAHNPERIFCGVVLQLEDGESHDETIWEQIVSLAKTNANVRYVRLHSKDAMGPCYARGLSQMLHRGEDYVLQIDAHMRFRPNWDEYLIQQHQALVDSTNNPKVMLTTYPIGYTLPNNIPRDETRGTVLVPWKFDDAGMLRQRGRLIKSKSEYKHSGPQPHGASPLAQHCLFAGGFNFAPSRVLTDVPYDTMGLPFLFFGEELSMAVRLYTNGYDLYAPRETVCYHLWSRSHRPTPRIGSKEKEQEKSRQKTESQAIVVKQLLGDPSMVGAALGLGCERTAEEFADRLGVNFAQQNFVREGWENGDLTTEDFVGGGSSAVSSPDSLEAKIATLDPNSKAMATLAKFLGNM